MKMRAALLIFFFVLASKGNVFAETTLRAEVDKTSIAISETLTYKLVFTSTDSKLPAPTPPAFKDFVIVAQSQSSTMRWVRNKITTANEYVFILAPTKGGVLQIAPSTVKTPKGIISSEAFSITVVKSSSKPRPTKPEESEMPASEEPETTL